jgi:dienelactone hydrolase
MNRLTIISFVCILSVIMLSPALHASVKGEDVDYKANGVVLKGYLAYDDAIEGERPGVLVVHEWWGHNEYARGRARMLAGMGYTALAVDMYGNGKTAEHPDNAAKFSSEVMKNQEVARGRFMAALEVLKGHGTVNPDRIAAIGYCFGGGVVLAMARSGVDLDGVVSFHGNLSTTEPARTGEVKTSILVCHGADDPFVSEEQIETFKKEMKSAEADLTFKSYEGAVHSFTNPDADRIGKKFDLPLAYNQKADQKSWSDMQSFFDRIFKEE